MVEPTEQMTKTVSFTETPACDGMRGDDERGFSDENLEDFGCVSMSQLTRTLSTRECFRCASTIIELSRVSSDLDVQRASSAPCERPLSRSPSSCRSLSRTSSSLHPSRLTSTPESTLSDASVHSKESHLASLLTLKRESSGVFTSTPAEVRANTCPNF